MLQDDVSKWQNGCDEIDNIKSNREAEKLKRYKINAKTMQNKIWIPEKKRSEFIIYTHEIMSRWSKKNT